MIEVNLYEILSSSDAVTKLQGDIASSKVLERIKEADCKELHVNFEKIDRINSLFLSRFFNKLLSKSDLDTIKSIVTLKGISDTEQIDIIKHSLSNAIALYKIHQEELKKEKPKEKKKYTTEEVLEMIKKDISAIADKYIGQGES